MSSQTDNPVDLSPSGVGQDNNVGDNTYDLEQAHGTQAPVQLNLETASDKHLSVKVNFASRPGWLKKAGEEYSTSIRVLNVNQNKDHCLSTFLEEAKAAGECLAVVTQAALCTKNKNFKVEADKLRRFNKSDWQIRLLPSDSDSREGMILFTRGGWNVRRVDNVQVSGTKGRLAVVRGLDPTSMFSFQIINYS